MPLWRVTERVLFALQATVGTGLDVAEVDVEADLMEVTRLVLLGALAETIVVVTWGAWTWPSWISDMAILSVLVEEGFLVCVFVMADLHGCGLCLYLMVRGWLGNWSGVGRGRSLRLVIFDCANWCRGFRPARKWWLERRVIFRSVQCNWVQSRCRCLNFTICDRSNLSVYNSVHLSVHDFIDLALCFACGLANIHEGETESLWVVVDAAGRSRSSWCKGRCNSLRESLHGRRGGEKSENVFHVGYEQYASDCMLCILSDQGQG